MMYICSRRIWLIMILSLGWLFLWQSAGCSKGECRENAECASYQVCLDGKCSGTPPAEETASEPVAEDAGTNTKCPTRCSKDLDCIFCGTRKTCDPDSNSCVDAREICPEVCNNDEDCQRTGCAEKQACNLVSGKCFQRIPECPDSCTTDADCKNGGCGERTACSARFKTCVDPTVANCPFTCRADADCAKDCGNRNRCSRSSPFVQTGTCRVLGTGQCPSSCRSTIDCFVAQCGEKVFCNYATNRCVTKEEACPTSCNTDADCSKHCGTRTFCYKASPGVGGYCRTPTTRTSCPGRCQTSYDCKAKACGEKEFCHLQTRKCVAAKDACPGRCQSNADCAASKCGTLTTCRNSRCAAQ